MSPASDGPLAAKPLAAKPLAAGPLAAGALVRLEKQDGLWRLCDLVTPAVLL